MSSQMLTFPGRRLKAATEPGLTRNILAGARLAVSLTAGMLTAPAASAATLSFTESTIATGGLGGTPFTNALVTLSGTGSTGDVTNPSSGLYTLVGIPIEVTVAGVGTGTFTDTMQLAANQNVPAVGIGDNSTTFGVLFAHVATAGYNLSRSFGPATGSATYTVGNFGTTAGDLYLASAGAVTYQATVSPNPVPEPATWAILLAGFVGVGAAVRSRRTNFAQA